MVPVKEQIAHANGIEIACDTFGDQSDPALLLIMGLGMQLIHWDERFCELLADRGFHVIRFDNRDTGRTTKIVDGPPPNVWASLVGRTGSASYTLDDMAIDSIGLLDHLGIEAAHVVGVSMGGMIAQTMAIRHPERVLSLCSIMSTTGNRRVGRPRLAVLSVLFRRAPAERAAYIDHFVEVFGKIGSPRFPADDARVRKLAAEGYDRCFYPIGVARQLVAIAASGDRTRALGLVHAPTLVLHGRDDPLIPLSGGKATAKAVPGAELLEIPGMGHDLPVELWPQIADAIVENAGRADTGSPAGAYSGTASK